MKNKTATECWNILRGELDSAIDSYVPMNICKGNGLKRNICQRRLSKRLVINKGCGGFINIRGRLKIMKFTKKHQTLQQTKKKV